MKFIFIFVGIYYPIIITNKIIKNKPLPVSDEKWQKTASTRKDFQELCKFNLNISEEEFVKKFRATYFPGALDYPNIEIGGNTYFLVDPQEFKKES